MQARKHDEAVKKVAREWGAPYTSTPFTSGLLRSPSMNPQSQSMNPQSQSMTPQSSKYGAQSSKYGAAAF
jgi:hypothetical protein